MRSFSAFSLANLSASMRSFSAFSLANFSASIRAFSSLAFLSAATFSFAFAFSSFWSLFTISFVSGVAFAQSKAKRAGVFLWNDLPPAATSSVTLTTSYFSLLVKWYSFSWFGPPSSVRVAVVPLTVRFVNSPTYGPNAKSFAVT